MTPDLESALARMLGLWSAGGSAFSAAPAEWGVEGDELAALAVAGQALETLFRPVPTTAPQPRPPLPHIDARLLSEELRPLFRRLLKQAGKEADGQKRLLVFLARRGRAPHPMDWTPAENDEIPELYEPWRTWAARAAQSAEALTAETWADWTALARRSRLAAMRKADPAAALALIAAQAPAEGAEERLKLVGLLGERLSEADAPFLEGLAGKDRSDKVKRAAKGLLARLGRAALDADVSELLGFLEHGREGILKRRTFVRARRPKDWRAAQRRQELFEQTTFARLAAAFSLSEPELVDAWDSRDNESLGLILNLLLETGSDAAVRAFAARSLELDAGVFFGGVLAGRMTPDERRAFARAGLRIKSSYPSPFLCAALWTDQDSLWHEAADLKDSPSWAGLTDGLKKDHKDYAAASGLFLLGLLASHRAAPLLIEDLAATGLSRADPRLDMLTLNAALPPEITP